MMNHPLLLEIQRFAVGKNAFHREEPPEGEFMNKMLEAIFDKENSSTSSDSDISEKEPQAPRRFASIERLNLRLLLHDF